MFEEIITWANKLERFSFGNLNRLKSVQNGIYLLFEKGEKVEGFDRIVRVGSHPSQGRFCRRLTDHFNKKQRASIMRKHIGRCFLNRTSDSYIHIWNFNNVKVKRGGEGELLVDLEKESLIESMISSYLKNFHISVIPSLDERSKRMELETRLIATLNTKNWKYISENWIGRHHPNSKIANSGLWNIQGLDSIKHLTEEDLEFIKVKTQG